MLYIYSLLLIHYITQTSSTSKWPLERSHCSFTFHVSRNLLSEYLEKTGLGLLSIVCDFFGPFSIGWFCVLFWLRFLFDLVAIFWVYGELLSILVRFSSRHAAVKVGGKHLSTKRLKYLPIKSIKMKFKPCRNNGSFAGTNRLAIAGKIARKISRV